MPTKTKEDTDEFRAVEPDTETSEFPAVSAEAEIVYEVETDVLREVKRPPVPPRRSR